MPASRPNREGRNRRMKTIHRKALRDLWRMRGQALAIALIIAAGVALLVMSQATLLSLQNTQAKLYAEQRFSDIWVSVKRAPQSLAERMAAIPGIAEVELRLASAAKLMVRDFDEPVQAQVQTLPKRQNLLHLRSGRLPESPAEILISDAFAEAHGFAAGERLRAIVQGRAQWLTVSGIAVSAEHLYQVKPGTLFPDFKRYAIVWMPEEALAAALDMKGAFNQAVIRLDGSETERDTVARLDRLLARYGSTGATIRKDQISHAILDSEFRQLATMATLFPVIFLAVAAFLLNMVFKRLIALQREQIAILKAFGYRTTEIALHYALIVSLITLFGAALGVALGAWMGQGLAALYQKSFHFPYLNFTVDGQVALLGTLISLLAALAGTAWAVFAAAREPVAEAMRPPAPARYRKTLLETLGLSRLISQPTRMVWRQLEHRPFKALLTILALAFASAIVIMAQFQYASVEHLAAVEYRLASRHDILATFTGLRPHRTLYELRAIDGVDTAEGTRGVPVRISRDNRSKLVTLHGIDSNSTLHHLIDTSLQRIPLPEQGLVLDDMLADILGVQSGEHVWVEILEGRRQHLRLPVVRRIPGYAGLAAYMNLDTLNRTLGDSDLINSARLVVQDGKEKSVLRELDQHPQILGAEERSAGLAALYRMLEENLGIFSTVVLAMALTVNIGILYNTIRMSLSERSRELASLRVLGFRKSEISYILFGEIAILVLASIPVGLLCGYGLAALIAYGLQNELYRIPFIIYPSSYAYTALITLASAALSALAVYRRIHTLDLIEVLKTRE